MSGRASSYIKSMRPETWFLGSLPILFMGLLASDFSLRYETVFGILELIIIIVILLLGGTNMFNEVFDIEADKINKPDRSIVSGKLSRNSALVGSLILMGSGVVWSCFVSLPVFLLSIAAFVFSICYSLPSIRFKDHPLTSMLTLGVGYGFIIPISSWFLFKDWHNLTAWLIILMSFCWFFGTTNSKDFADVEGDRAKGTKTLPILIGKERTIQIMVLLMVIIPSFLLVSYVVIGVFPLWTLLTFASYVATFAVLFWLSRNLTRENSVKAYKAMYLLYPSIFVFLAIGFWLGGHVL